ncbi:MAG TPA: DUF4037 domain-containing protein [Chthonomonadaceae bacterium]|nr:DUF4037 domain-containing protein [Chthonomonadaceae bacterium]
MSSFMPGLELSRRFYAEVIAPILAQKGPGLPYSAALIGDGSEVLGFDTEMSADHCWGPRVLLFLGEDADAGLREDLTARLLAALPPTFCGYATRIAPPEQSAAAQYTVQIFTLRGFFRDYLAFEIEREIAPADWLTFPEQKLRAITSGAVFHDEVGLQAVRERFAYYPRDVWLYLLAAGWTRIGQEEHLMGRAGFVGDEVGSAIIGARLARDLMRLGFLMARQYAPYPKWFGTAFARLPCGPDLLPVLKRVLQASTWQERENHLVAAYETIAAWHNRLGITEPRPEKAAVFFDRPFRVIELSGGFAEAICAHIEDPDVQHMARKRLIGSIDQFSDSTDLLSDPGWRETLRGLYS